MKKKPKSTHEMNATLQEQRRLPDHKS